MRILAMNTIYEKMLRNNLLTCLQRLEIKFANEGDNLMNKMDEVYNKFLGEFKKKLEEKYSKDVLDINVDAPPAFELPKTCPNDAFANLAASKPLC